MGAPLSDVKTTSVFLSILFAGARITSITSPTTESSSSVASPIGPRALRPQNPCTQTHRVNLVNTFVWKFNNKKLRILLDDPVFMGSGTQSTHRWRFHAHLAARVWGVDVIERKVQQEGRLGLRAALYKLRGCSAVSRCERVEPRGLSDHGGVGEQWDGCRLERLCNATSSTQVPLEVDSWKP